MSQPLRSSSASLVACGWCGEFYKTYGPSQCLRRHGYGGNKPACQGSDQPTISTSSMRLPASQPLPSNSALPPPSSSSFSSSSASSSAPPRPQLLPPVLPPDPGSMPFQISKPARATLTRIPKGARDKAASELNRRLRAVISSPTSLTSWESLLNFASCLSQPARGGIHRNLTTAIVKQLDGASGTPCVVPSRDRAKSSLSEEDLIVRRASQKLQEGYVSGAARCLIAEESFFPAGRHHSRGHDR